LQNPAVEVAAASGCSGPGNPASCAALALVAL